MAIPAFTLENIQNHISDVAYGALSKVCSDEQLLELSKPEGGKITVRGNFHNVRMGWHRDETNTIDGIFLRTYTKDFLLAYKILKNHDAESPYLITVTPQHTTLSKELAIHVTLANRIFAFCAVQEGDMRPIFEVEDLKDPEAIQAFFAKNADMLPDTIRERVFPQAPPKPSANNPINSDDSSGAKSDYSFLYIASAMLLVLGIAFVAKRYFAAPREV